MKKKKKKKIHLLIVLLSNSFLLAPHDRFARIFFLFAAQDELLEGRKKRRDLHAEFLLPYFTSLHNIPKVLNQL